MPLMCCVPGCKANYATSTEGYVSVFKFPNNENLRKAWLKKIPRKDWTPGPAARVCELHFAAKFVSKSEEYVDKDGNRKTFPRKRAVLAKDAVPTNFPNVPKYLSDKIAPERNDPAKRRKLAEDRHEEAVRNFIASDYIKDFESLRNSYQMYVKSTVWKFEIEDDRRFIAYIPVFENSPKIAVCIQIDSSMHVEVYENGYRVPANDLTWLMANNSLLTLWSQFENLLSRYAANSSSSEPTSAFLQEVITSSFHRLFEFFEEDQERTVKLNFLLEQFQLVFPTKNARRYSPDMMIHSFMIHMLSPACYDGLRNNCLLTLPHETRLIQLTRSFGASIEDVRKNKHFLKLKAECLCEREKFLVMQVDEIYVKNKVDYKNGKLYGYAENTASLQTAKTICAVLISSAFGRFKEVVSLKPVNKLTAKDLVDIVSDAVALVFECGLKVIVLVTDNNAVNRKLFDELCGEGNYEWIRGGDKIYCTFDSVHIAKSWRNNWLNQKDHERTFLFPDFDDFTRIRYAKFSILRGIYEKEKHCLIRDAPKLNYKTVYPSNLEKQKVILALNVWHESSIAAVRKHDGEGSDTAAMLDIIQKWWNIMNIQNQVLHIHLRKEIAKPFTSIMDERLLFLQKFLEWLEHWKPVRNHVGFLTDETYASLRRQTTVMIRLIHFALTELKVPYFLPGKVQTDILEKRFSKYRNLAGNNYNVSVVQVLESEKKLRLQSLLGLKSARYGTVKFHFDDLTDVMIDEQDNVPIDPREISLFQDFFDDEFQQTEFPDSSLIFVCGYVTFKLKAKLECTECVGLFVSVERTDDQYFKDIDRGGLSVPSNVCLELGNFAFLVMQHLISAKYESNFVTCTNQRNIFLHLMREGLFLLHYSEDDTCSVCDKKLVQQFHFAFKIFANVLLNNYSKCKNNMAASAAASERMDKRDKKNSEVPVGKIKSSATRKLSTLKK